MKTDIFTFVFLFLFSCIKTTEVADMGNTDTAPLGDMTSRKMPTAEECFQQINADDCYAAGCQAFFVGDVIIETEDGTCQPVEAGVACWTTINEPTLDEGTVFWWYYDLENGQRKHIYTSGFAGVLGWKTCEGDCPCIIEERE